MGIEVVDHIIVGEQGYFSYREAGRLQCPERP
jgi:DNA repair protein RadC